MLSCGRLLSAEQLALHRHNLVVHESALPQGQGWSPMTWQILEGASTIPIILFEAVAELDAGPIDLQQQIDLQGHELVDEWRVLQAQATLELCLAWFDRHRELLTAANPNRASPATTAGADLPILSWIRIAAWLSSSICFVAWTISVIRHFFIGETRLTHCTFQKNRND